ncbi:GH32 C-terminal domain-containing protein [Sunxiuqinia sp. A32]|uniref:GH32 C-terminal domain-containing protein n=1 Tax=Sunxiuqinia sp. A32 TaxID=3461496 RepID=UPI004045647A
MKYIQRVGFLFLMITIFACDRMQNGEGKSGIHFSTGEIVLDEPVSLLFFDNSYHLYYEFTTNQKIRKLGHAKSSDLLNWKTLPTKINSGEEHTVGKGSIVYDINNSSGLGMKIAPLVGIFPIQFDNELGNENQEQALQILFSEDAGSNWIEYADGLIKLDNFYSPISNIKISWDEKNQKWVMLILSGYDISFYLSDDLINWEFVSSFGNEVFAKTGEWTKLDFFPLEVKETNETKWILFVSGDSGSPNQGSGIQYFTGDFDGYVFKADRDKPKWLDNGSDNYLGIVLSDYLLNVKDAVFLGSICNLKYRRQGDTENSANELTVPRTLNLSNSYNGLSILSKPVDELAAIESDKKQLKETQFSGELKIKETFDIPFEINLLVDGDDRLYLDMAKVFGIKFSNNAGEQLVIGYHNQRANFFILDPTKNSEDIQELKGFDYAPYVSNKQPIDLKIIVDKNSIELFALDGLISLTRKYSFEESQLEVTLYTEEGNITIKEASISLLNGVLQGYAVLN